jgi:hypothetical protein
MNSFDGWQTDPYSGRKPRLASLGYAVDSMLSLQSCERGCGVDLLLTVRDGPRPRISRDLLELIETSWTWLEFAGNRPLPTPRPIPITGRPDTFWLCRLAPGKYLVEAYSDSVSELFELDEPALHTHH